MVNADQIASAIVGAVSLAYAVRTIATKRATFSSDEDEPDLWLYGWRAVLIGLCALLISALCIASALGYVNLFHEWRG